MSFVAETVVPAAQIVEGDVVHARRCGVCQQPTLARRVTDLPSGQREVALGCWCGTFGTATLWPEHVLSYSGVVAILT